jgi:uncharacterized protein (DUF58 family)
MHLTGRALTLIALAAALGIASLWTEAASLRDLWLVPIVLLAAGLAFESARVARLRLAMRLRPPAAVLLGQACEFHLELSADQSVAIEWLLSPPVQLEGEIAVQALRLRADRATHTTLAVLPVRLGYYDWAPAAARLRGVLGLADWSRLLPLDCRGRVACPARAASSRSCATIARGIRCRASPGSAARATGGC